MPRIYRQAAVVALRQGKVCLITSRTQRRWVIPKGHIEPGQTSRDAAECEAWEEAGLRGRLEPVPLGTYRYRKNERIHHVVVYLMDVSATHDVWPECLIRKRHWLTPNEALERIRNKSLRAILAKVAGHSGDKSMPSSGGIRQ